jgi:hypothetical protein
MTRVELLLVILSFLASSCVKNVTASNGKAGLTAPFYSADSNHIFCYVVINAGQVVDNNADSGYLISALGAFADSVSKNAVTIEHVAINSRVLNPASIGIFEMGYSDSTGTLAEGVALAGTDDVVRITGNTSGDTLTQVVTVPKFLLRKTTDFPSASGPGAIDNSKDLDLNWVADPNPSTDGVAIHVYYMAGLSRSVNPALPGNVNSLQFTVPDNGTYTIPASAMGNFPKGCYVEIDIRRQSLVAAAVLPLSHRRIFFAGISSLTTTPLQVGGQ